MRHSIIAERKGAWEAGWGRERVALIKSLITRDRKRRALGAIAKSSWKCQLIRIISHKQTEKREILTSSLIFDHSSQFKMGLVIKVENLKVENLKVKNLKVENLKVENLKVKNLKVENLKVECKLDIKVIRIGQGL